MEEIKTGYIYCHINKINGWKYIGQTIEEKPEDRYGFKGQKYKPRNGWINPKGFWQAILDYGWDNFEHIILEQNIPIKELNDREKYWIDFYHTFVEDSNFQGGYNLTSGGDNTAHAVSEETRQRLREANLGKKASEETRLKMSENNKGEKNPFWGHTHSEETKKIISEKNKNREVSQELRDKISESLLGRKKSEETKEKMRKPKSEEHKQHIKENNANAKRVKCIETGKIYNSAIDAAKDTGAGNPRQSSHINEVCAGKRNVCNSYHWIWVDNNNNNTNEKTEEEILRNNLRRNTCSKNKKVLCIENNKIYISITQASEDTGANKSSIGAVCRGERKTAGGYHWRYVENNEN